MAKFLNLNGFLSPYRANDATEGFIEVDDELAGLVAEAYAEGKVLDANLETLHDIEDVAEKIAASEHPYLKAKAEKAAQALANAETVEDRINDYHKRIKENNGQGQVADA